MTKQANRQPLSKRARVLFAAVVIVWFAFDRITKAWTYGARPGDVLIETGGYPFEFRLLHNTGAAWGIFHNATILLGVVGVVFCMFIVWYLFYIVSGATLLEQVGLALVCAGGLGNAVDRFAFGYVIDFINCTFITFPVFNVADIGVTCGFLLFFIAWFYKNSKECRGSYGCDKTPRQGKDR